MSRVKNYVVAAVGLVILASALVFSNPSTVNSAPTPPTTPVNVVNTPDNPVPTAAQGTTLITGSVGISGTPTVLLAPRHQYWRQQHRSQSGPRTHGGRPGQGGLPEASQP